MIDRVTVSDIHRGLGGWSQFKIVKDEDYLPFSLIIMTTQPQRPNGHIGELSTQDRMAHASTRMGFIEVPFRKGTSYYKMKTLVRQVCPENCMDDVFNEKEDPKW